MVNNRKQPIFQEERAIPEKWRIDRPIEQACYLAGGRLTRWDGPMEDVVSPIWIGTPSGPVPRGIGRSPVLSAAEGLAAGRAASDAYGRGLGAWPRLHPEERVGHVNRFTAELQRKRAEIIRLLVWETGKPVPEAVDEFDRTIDYISRSIAALGNGDLSPKACDPDGPRTEITRAPIGVALCLGSYNFPLNETLDTVIPALLMGNTVVFKPPRFGVLLYGCLLEAFRDCFPPGVVNVIFGDNGATDALMTSGIIDILAVIGTKRVAESLYRLHPRPLTLRLIMGLEAKNPAVVFADADLEQAVDECCDGALRFNGQRCTALKIIFVHARVADAFLRRLVERVDRLTCGLPWEDNVVLTPLPDRERIACLTELVDDALLHGGRILNRGGGTVDGSFFSPAVIYPVNAEMRLYREEQFGPIIPVVPFEDSSEPIASIAQSNLAQQISIFAGEATAREMVQTLRNQACRININRRCQRGPDYLPFGARKDSGVGVRSVADTLRAFSLPLVIAG
jgi:glyceraldehyde-3-phosphate dehydrogenase (NADP+)